MLITDEHIKYYREKTLSELQSIKPKWAIGKNINQLLNQELNPKRKEFRIFTVNLKNLIDAANFYEVNIQTLFTNRETNDNRIARILYRWESNQFVDPPAVELCNEVKGKLSFSDGRHRTKLSYYLECKDIPIAIHHSQIEDVSVLVELLAV